MATPESASHIAEKGKIERGPERRVIGHAEWCVRQLGEGNEVTDELSSAPLSTILRVRNVFAVMLLDLVCCSPCCLPGVANKQ